MLQPRRRRPAVAPSPTAPPLVAGSRALPWLTALMLLAPAPAQAGLWRPVLDLLRPQLQERLTRTCMETVSEALQGALKASPQSSRQLEDQLREPCRRLAGPASHCLVREADASGNSLALLQELLQRQLGPESERILQRCTARLLGLPPDSLAGLSLRQLAQRFGLRRP